MRNLVAFYQTRNQAEAVRDELVSAGYDSGNITVRSPSSGDDKGLWESIKEAFGFADEQDHQIYAEASRRGAYSVILRQDDNNASQSQERAVEIMRRHNPIDLDQQATEWKSQGWTGYRGAQTAPAATAATATTQTNKANRRSTPAQGQEVIPVVQEELQVGKRQVQQGGVRVYSRVTERPVQEQINLREEHVSVERRPVDRPVTNADAAFQERTIEATESAEKAVVNKQARVVEEVALNKHVEERTETVNDTVRRTDVDVEKLQPGQAGAQADWTDEFVTTLSNDQRYRGRDWNTIETDARSSFEQRYPGRKWDQVKDQIRRGYDKVRSRV